MTPKVTVITGPTATGKTHLGVLLAQKYGGEVVSADSMQVYKGMDIGTAKPTPQETQGIPHHMINVVTPGENYSVSHYAEDAGKRVDNILSRGKLPIIVGGTGLYIEALLSGREYAPEAAETGLRDEIYREYDERGGEEMRRLLAEFDPESAARFHANDKKRIVRAFEIYRLSGKTMTQHDEETRCLPPRYDSCRIALNFADRKVLYSRIDRRVDLMLVQGLVAEVQALLDRGLDRKTTAMQAIGYKEIASALRGERTMEEAVASVKQESRRYAKRQLSWFGRDKDLHWITWENEPDFGQGLRDSTKYLESHGIL